MHTFEDRGGLGSECGSKERSGEIWPRGEIGRQIWPLGSENGGSRMEYVPCWPEGECFGDEEVQDLSAGESPSTSPDLGPLLMIYSLQITLLHTLVSYQCNLCTMV